MQQLIEKVKKGFTQKSIFRRYLFNNLIVLILPLLALTAGSSRIASMIVDDSISAQNRTLIQMVENLDDTIINLQKTSIQISNDSAVQRFYRVTSPLKVENRIEAFSMMGALAKYYSSNELIEQFFLYFPHSGRIITRSAMYEPDFFFNHIVRYEEMSENNWNEILSSGPYRSEYLRGDITISDSKTIPTITYMTSLPAENYRFNRAILCVILNVEKIRNRLTGMAPGGALYVMNKNGETLCAVGATDAYYIDEASAYATSEGVTRLSIHSEKTTVLNKTSDSSGWRYLFVIPDALLARSAYALTAFL